MSDDSQDEAPSVRVSLGRLAIGLAQGAALYLLYRAMDAKGWPASDPALFAALAIAIAFTPLLLLSELGRMRPLVLAAWTVIAAIVLAAIGAHDILRDPVQAYRDAPRLLPDVPVWLFSAAALFIAHSLVVAADGERRVRASYAAYADTAWTRGVRLALSAGFTGVFWLILWLGAALFALINLKGFGELIREPWFAIPATSLVFAAAVHLTDVRTALVRSVRAVVLALLSWLSPVMALIVAGFICALPFTGLEPLWSTRSAAAILLAASAALVILLNTAYQDGRTPPPAALRWTGLLVAVLLAPLALIAAYAVALRVGQYGWTPERIYACACLIVALIYAVGYLVAAIRSWRGSWLRGVEATNLIAAAVSVLLIVCLFTPLADPSRIAVQDQVARLERGAVSAEAFDYRFLKFDSGRYGREALARLGKTAADPAVRRRAAQAQALKRTERWGAHTAPADLDPATRARQIKVYPEGRALPPGFLEARLERGRFVLPQCLREAATCDAFVLDLDGDGADDVLIGEGSALTLFHAEAGAWRSAGAMAPAYCKGVMDALRAGKAEVSQPRWRDLVVAGQRLRLTAQSEDCASGG